ncbi:hypothetical protein ACOME3_003883 [Neoechinorhynchus agilis]
MLLGNVSGIALCLILIGTVIPKNRIDRDAMLDALSGKLVEQIRRTEAQLPLLNWYSNASVAEWTNSEEDDVYDSDDEYLGNERDSFADATAEYGDLTDPFTGVSPLNVHERLSESRSYSHRERMKDHVLILSGHFGHDGSLHVVERSELVNKTFPVSGLVVWVKRKSGYSSFGCRQRSLEHTLSNASRHYVLVDRNFPTRSTSDPANEYLKLRVRHRTAEKVDQLFERLTKPLAPSSYARCLQNHDVFIELRYKRPVESNSHRRSRRTPRESEEFLKVVKCEPHTDCCLMTASIPLAPLNKVLKAHGEELKGYKHDHLQYSFCAGRCYRKKIMRFNTVEACCTPLAMRSIRLHHYKNTHGILSLSYPISARSCGCV